MTRSKIGAKTGATAVVKTGATAVVKTGATKTVKKIRVAIANDTVIALEALRRAIATSERYELIWTAKNGQQAVEKCWSDPPDLVLMDLLMPGLDGVEATRQIMANNRLRVGSAPTPGSGPTSGPTSGQATPCAILIVTASVHRNTSKVFEAMGHGALDVVTTPSLPSLHDESIPPEAAAPLLAKMDTVIRFMGKPLPKERPPTAAARQPLTAKTELWVIGASTGGPRALAEILGQLPASCRAAIVVIQHIDQQFAPGLADWLNQQSALKVVLAEPGDRPEAGTVLLAQGHGHLRLLRGRTLAYTTSNVRVAGKGAQSHHRPSPYCPSVDVFFKSVAQYWPQPGKAVLLTGMGRDGALGLSALQAKGWLTIAESEQSCVVYGMPRAAIALGAARRTLPRDEIAAALLQKAASSKNY